MEGYHRRKPQPPIAPASQPAFQHAPLNMAEMDWEARFKAAWDALCKMECRAETAEMEIERLTGRAVPWKR